ncbi:MAG TPA: MBL fold metallo-hydrolase [Candidatus Saccharimonadales bacterium]|nr:MBL fold metallo-hydrolase [Candidatus Saccharimonadales bacterium]
MKITIVGAAGGEVTGSAYYVQTQQASVLVDCGLFQGGRKSEALNRPPARPKQKLDAVLLTHGHLDHTGRLPLLANRGHAMPIFATPATIEMTALILRDSARIQMSDTERQNRKRARAGEPPLAPLYTPEDAEKIIQQLRPVSYQEPVPVAPGIQAIWAESGHMLGSASIQLLVEEDGRTKRVVFSGDLGPKGALILKDFEPFRQADLVFLESTYGGRDHRPFQETAEEFVRIVQDTVEQRGKILVPTFAVGRAQLITGLLGWMFRKRKVKPFPLFLDSPMAIEATNIYLRHRELFDEGMTRFIEEKPLREDLKTLKLCVTAQDSMKINEQPGPALVMAGAGMCNAGRILHHLKANLWKPDTHVLIVGYQGDGSLGRRLVNGEPLVSIHGEKIAVKAKVHTLGGFSAHAGQTDLLGWFSALAPAKPRVVLTHGEDDARQALARSLQQRFKLKPALPLMGETIEL